MAQESTDGPVSYSRDIRPILSDRCFHCHGPDAANQESEFRLDTEEHAKQDLGGYAGLVPGDLANSLIHERIWSEDDPMPPEDSVRKLSDSEKKLLDRWIREGGRYEKHWSFRPVPKKPEIPIEEDSSWSRNEIDRFVVRQAKSNGLTPNPDAEKSTWLRRVTFDLIGLPPTPEQLAEFLADNSSDAFENVVDRLLKSDAYAERMTAEWLDVARYSDTYGFQRDGTRRVWPYRDWVLRAFQNGMPYNEFLTKQIAGDLLPNATQDDRLATAFNRLHSHKVEGGSNEEEFRVENVADRTHTVATAFLGLTMECARCHDHKYDPISSREYYQLSSFFSNIDENGLISFFTSAVPTPAMPLFNKSNTAQLKAAQREIDAAIENLKRIRTEAKAGFPKWLTNPRFPERHWKDGEFLFDGAAETAMENWVAGKSPARLNANKLVPGKIGNGVQLSGDDKLSFPNVGQFDRAQPFSFSLWIKPAKLHERAVIFCRSRAWDDAGSMGYELLALGKKLSAKLVHFWPGNAIAIETGDVLQKDQWTHVGLMYDGSSRAAGLKLFVNGRRVPVTIVQDRLTRSITSWGGAKDLVIGERFRDRGFKNGIVDELRVFSREISELEMASHFRGQDAWSLEPVNNELWLGYYLSVASPKVKSALEKVEAARRKWNQAMDRIPAIMVMRESQKSRTNFLLERGDYTSRGEKVEAGTPAVLLPFGARPKNRLGLANWLTDPAHPLTARVVVNRYWQLFFGRGIVSTPEDFGLQGAPPTHPALLDYLARDLVDHQWDLRHFFKKVVLSSTYRQQSITSAEQRSIDPENKWLTRFPRKRLSAEMIRDNALFVSGLLVQRVGGPSVKTYDLEAAFKPSKPSGGDGVYRRSIYTFWQRTAPAPLLMTMNASKREVCRMKRDETNSPLQALLLLNGTQFVEAARACAEELMRGGKEPAQSILVASEKLLSRPPSTKEKQILLELYNEQMKLFEFDPTKVKNLLGVGNKPADPNLEPAKLAALTVVVNAMMSLDEALRVR